MTKRTLYRNFAPGMVVFLAFAFGLLVYFHDPIKFEAFYWIGMKALIGLLLGMFAAHLSFRLVHTEDISLDTLYRKRADIVAACIIAVCLAG